MCARFLLAALACLFPGCACCQAHAGAAAAAADNLAIHRLLDHYAQAVDTVDLRLLAEIWSHSPEVSFIYPLGEEHGFDAIVQNVFEKVMGGMFSTRDLKMHDVAIYVKGESAWSEFRWDFHATLRKDGSAVTTHGVETQVYRKENGQWRLVHVHYSEDRQAIP
jgi:ketosteroid isomerase-like protein